jgi:hypothetical protein
LQDEIWIRFSGFTKRRIAGNQKFWETAGFDFKDSCILIQFIRDFLTYTLIRFSRKDSKMWLTLEKL